MLIDVAFSFRSIKLLDIFVHFINELKGNLRIWWKVSMIIAMTRFQMFKLVHFFICPRCYLFCEVTQNQRINSRCFLFILYDLRQEVGWLIGEISKR